MNLLINFINNRNYIFNLLGISLVFLVFFNFISPNIGLKSVFVLFLTNLILDQLQHYLYNKQFA